MHGRSARAEEPEQRATSHQLVHALRRMGHRARGRGLRHPKAYPPLLSRFEPSRHAPDTLRPNSDEAGDQRKLETVNCASQFFRFTLKRRSAWLINLPHGDHSS